MDWFTWLSRTGLGPFLVHDYAVTFTSNELGEEDIPYFSHEFLQSMGVSIAKHRLEILKLARKTKNRRTHPAIWLMFTIKQTKDYLSKHIRELVHPKSSTLSVLPKRNNSLRWKVAMLQRNKKWNGPTPEWTTIRCDVSPRAESVRKTLMITNGSPNVESLGAYFIHNSTSTESKVEVENISTMVESQDGGYWSSSMEEIKWDSMFYNLNPT